MEFEIKNITVAPRKMKYLDINLLKLGSIHEENYKTLLKKIKGLKQWIVHIMDR